jgi:Ulp1 family protease
VEPAVPSNAVSSHGSPSQLSVLTTEDYQTAVSAKNLNTLMDMRKEVENNIIDAYLNVLITQNDQKNAGKFGLMPTYVYKDKKDSKFAPKWLEGIKRTIGQIRYWLIPAHLNNNHWVLVVWDVQEKKMNFYDSLNSQLIEDQLKEENSNFMPTLRKVMEALYAQCGEPREDRFVKVSCLKPKNLPKQVNNIDCGVFMLMFAKEIVETGVLNPTMDIDQKTVPKARQKIYDVLLPFCV